MTRSTRYACFCTAQTSIFQQKFVILFSTLEMLKSMHFSNFVAIFADVNEICSDFLRFCRKNNAEKQWNDFILIFIMIYHDYTGHFFKFRPNFRLNFQFNFHQAAPPEARAEVRRHAPCAPLPVCAEVAAAGLASADSQYLGQYPIPRGESC